MLEFKPFDIDSKTYGYRAEENGEKIGECEQKRYGNPGRKEDSRRYGGLFAGERDGG